MIFINSSSRDSFKIFQNFSPIFPPFGIGYLMAMLERENIKSYFVDEVFEKDAFVSVANFCKLIEPPYIFGFNVLTLTYKNALKLSERLKRNFPDSVIIFGGVHSSMMPDEVLINESVDVVVRGEADLFISELFKRIKKRQLLIDISGVSYKSKGQIIHNKPSSNLIEMDDLPLFPYHYFDRKKYNFGYVMSSRGCPYSCIFCSKISGNSKVRSLSVDKVMAQLSDLYETYKLRHVLFVDDDLLFNKNRAIELSDRIKKSRFYGNMQFSFGTRGDNCDPKLLKMMYDAGFKGVFIGVETATENLMQTIKKGESLAKAIEGVKIAKTIGYHVSTNFIFGLPGEKQSDRIQAFKLAKELKLDLVKYNNATPFPGTLLYDIAKKENRLNVIGLYENFIATAVITENPFNKISLPYVPYGNTEKQIRYSILFGTFIFYFRIRKIVRVFSSPKFSNSWFDFGENPYQFIKKIPKVLILLFFLFIKFSQSLIIYSVLLITKKKS